MPMRPELYPDDWSEIALAVKEANAWTCQECDRECLRPGDALDGLTRSERARNTLTVAHYESIYDAPEILLLALCAGCHLAHDHQHNLENRKRPVRRLYRHTKQRRAGQLAIFTEGKAG